MTKPEQQAIESARIRFQQDEIIEGFVETWKASGMKERKQLPFRIINTPEGFTFIKDRKNNIIGEVVAVGDGMLKCRWVRSLDDLKQIRDAAGVIV